MIERRYLVRLDGRQVIACSERAAGTGQDGDADCGVGLGAAEHIVQLVGRLVAIGIELVGSLDRDAGNAVRLAERDIAVAAHHPNLFSPDAGIAPRLVETPGDLRQAVGAEERLAVDDEVGRAADLVGNCCVDR